MSDGTNDIPESVQPDAAFWHVPWEFAVHTLVGTCIFAIIAAAAVGLDLAVHKLRVLGVGSVIMFGLEAGEYALFATDLALFVVFLWRTARRTIRKL